MRNIKLHGLMLVIALLFAPLWAQADRTLAPENIEGSRKVTAEDIFALVEKIPDLLIIDARIRADRKQGYLESSVSLPDIKTNCTSLKKTIKKKSSPVLFYCNGPKCGRSAKSVEKALKCGYNKVYWFRGGFEEWVAKGFPLLKE